MTNAFCLPASATYFTSFSWNFNFLTAPTEKTIKIGREQVIGWFDWNISHALCTAPMICFLISFSLIPHPLCVLSEPVHCSGVCWVNNVDPQSKWLEQNRRRCLGKYFPSLLWLHHSFSFCYLLLSWVDKITFNTKVESEIKADAHSRFNYGLPPVLRPCSSHKSHS